jgi:hypothetical protein
MFKFLRRNTELEDALSKVEELRLLLKNQQHFLRTTEKHREHWQLCAVELDVAHNLLWKAHADILEGVTAKPNGTVRKFLKIAEQALIDCPVSKVKPEPKWTL